MKTLDNRNPSPQLPQTTRGLSLKRTKVKENRLNTSDFPSVVPGREKPSRIESDNPVTKPFREEPKRTIRPKKCPGIQPKPKA
jgi:hypothetical protein